MKLMPNFLIFGAAKSGTTAMWRHLAQHPEVYASPKKGPHFFACEPDEVVYEIGPGYKHIKPNFVTNLEAYQALFAGATTEKARGEASVMYIYYPDAPRRIQTSIPEVKLIAILRHPVERAFSAYLHKVREEEEVHSFAAALAEEEQRIQDGWTPLWHYRKMGFYYEQLKRYYHTFDAEQLKVYLYDDFQNEPLAVMQDLYGFLGIDDSFVPDTTVRRNISGVPKSKLLHRAHRFLKEPSLLKTVGKSILPAKLRGKLKARTLSDLQTKNLQKPVMSPEVRQDLLQSYRGDILELQGLIGRDLTHWLK